MPVAIIASVVGLIVALVAFYRDAPIEERRLHAPDWDLLPDPAEVARTEFPLAFPGYEPATVEYHFDLLTRAYADLLAVAPPDVIARARHRAALRAGVDMPAEAPAVPPLAAQPGPPGRGGGSGKPSPGAAPPDVDDAEALRAEAALADLQWRGPESR